MEGYYKLLSCTPNPAPDKRVKNIWHERSHFLIGVYRITMESVENFLHPVVKSGVVWKMGDYGSLAFRIDKDGKSSNERFSVLFKNLVKCDEFEHELYSSVFEDYFNYKDILLECSRSKRGREVILSSIRRLKKDDRRVQ